MKFLVRPNFKYRFPKVKLRENALLIPVPASHVSGAVQWGGGGLFLSSGKPDPLASDRMKESHRQTRENIFGAKSSAVEGLFCGAMKAHFGHFFCESIGRIWAIDKLRPNIPLVYMSKDSLNVGLAGTPSAFFTLIGLENPVVLVKEATRFAKIWNATSLFDPMIASAIHPRLLKWIESRLPNHVGNFGPKLYVSRSGISDNLGRVLGENVIEDGLKSVGYHIFRPEEHSLAEQISAYRNADHIVMSESSAIHLMSLFCNPKAKIALIKRRPSSPKAIVSAKTTFRSGDIHYIAAFKKLWYVDKEKVPADYSGVSELDFEYLWATLKRFAFIETNAKMPIPSDAEIAKEKELRAPDRVVFYELEPGTRYSKL